MRCYYNEWMNEAIKEYIKCCSILNDINRLEDDLMFDLSKLENVNNRNREVEEENENNITDEEESESEESEDNYYERNEEHNVVQDW